MGIYDRDYYRQPRRSPWLVAPRSVTATLIVINVAIFLVDYVLLPEASRGTLRWHLKVSVETLTLPAFWWRWWQFLTYGFIHAYRPEHIVMNMLGLWFFGRAIEERYGSKEFLRLYLTMLVFSSVLWVTVSKLQGAPAGDSIIGASGAVTGTIILFALNYPQAQVAFFFVLPMPAWFMGVLLVAGDAYGAISRPEGSRVAFVAHLAGAAFALLYFRQGWNLGRLLRLPSFWRVLKRRPRLRIHVPEEKDKELSSEVDRILAKISREKESSLTRKERRTLKNASRQYQKKRQSTRGGEG